MADAFSASNNWFHQFGVADEQQMLSDGGAQMMWSQASLESSEMTMQNGSIIHEFAGSITTHANDKNIAAVLNHLIDLGVIDSKVESKYYLNDYEELKTLLSGESVKKALTRVIPGGAEGVKKFKNNIASGRSRKNKKREWKAQAEKCEKLKKQTYSQKGEKMSLEKEKNELKSELAEAQQKIAGLQAELFDLKKHQWEEIAEKDRQLAEKEWHIQTLTKQLAELQQMPESREPANVPQQFFY